MKKKRLAEKKSIKDQYLPKDHGFSQETLKIQVEPSIHKSRRIENTKRNVFNSKLNKILFAVIFLLILLVLAMKLL